MEGDKLQGGGINLRCTNEINNRISYAAITASRCEGGGSRDAEEFHIDEEM